MKVLLPSQKKRRIQQLSLCFWLVKSLHPPSPPKKKRDQKSQSYQTGEKDPRMSYLFICLDRNLQHLFVYLVAIRWILFYKRPSLESIILGMANSSMQKFNHRCCTYIWSLQKPTPGRGSSWIRAKFLIRRTFSSAGSFSFSFRILSISYWRSCGISQFQA